MNRLKHIKLCDYRGFYGAHEVDMSADFVLVHGGNASGKTSLLSALEFVATGRVSDLASYSGDYPDCLEADGGIYGLNVTLTYEDSNGVEKQITRDLPKSKTETEKETALKLGLKEAEFFSKHAYLSQSRLSHLLELYGGIDGESDGRDQLLVRILRELLGLDLLENLRRGLYPDRHRSRLVERSDQLRQHDKSLTSLEEERSRINEQLRMQRQQWEAATKPLNEWLSAGNQDGSLPNRIEDGSDLRKILDYIERKRERTAPGRIVDHAEAIVARSLERLRSLEESESAESEAETTDVQQRISELKNSIKRHREKLLSNLNKFTKALNGYFRQERPINEHEPERAVTHIQSDVGEAIDDVTQRRKQLSEASERAKSIRRELKQLESESETPEDGEENIERAERRQTLLKHALHLLSETDECPVCGRDFRELESGTLVAHIEAELSNLGVAVDKLRSAHRESQRRQQRERELWQELERLSRQLGSDDKELEKIKKWYSLFDSLRSELPALDNVRKTIEAETAELRQQTEILRQRREAEEQHRYLENAIHDLAEALDIGLQIDPNTSAEKRAEQVLDATRSAREHQESVQSRYDEIFSITQRAIHADNAIEGLNRSEVDWQRRKDAADRREKSLKRLRNSTREVRRAIDKAETNIINNVVHSSLNTFWEDLFLRLAQDEIFRPRLDSLGRQGSRLVARYRTEGSSGHQFGHPGAILSSANLNTAALTLFLSLNLVHEAPVKPIVLDDPVQNMDDVHLMQLATLLRGINRQANRQLIIATHDQALYRYLATELAPTNANESLVCVDAERSGGACTIRSKRQKWEAEKLSFA